MSKILMALAIVAGIYGCTKPLSADSIINNSPDSSIYNFPVPDDRIDFTKCDTTIVFGDSWSDYAFNANNFIKAFADTSGQLIVNTAAIGLGSANMIAREFEKMSPINNKTNVLALCGFNDVRFTGATNELLNFQRNAYRMMLVNQFLKTWRPAGDADRKGGSFTSFDQPLSGHFKSYYSFGRKAAYTSSVNNVYLEYDFTGTNVGVSFVGQDTTAIASYEKPNGRWRVLIDGIVIDTPSIYQQTYGHIPGYMAPQTIFPYIKIYPGLSDGSHVLRLEPIEAGNKFVDFVFTLKDPALVNPVAILKIPYMTQAGYTIDPLFNKANDAAIDQVNAAITGVRNEFVSINAGYSKKIKVINTADYFDKNTGYLPDLIHPNPPGQTDLFTALKKNIRY